MKIKEIFEKISKDEDHEFVVGQLYEQNTKFSVETEDGYANVKSMVIKKTDSIHITFASEATIVVAKNHVIKKDNDSLVNAGDLKIGDKLYNKNTNYEEIVSIGDLGEQLVYDISIDRDDYLYCDAQGFVHHNTYHITEGPKSLKKLLGPEGGKWTYHSGTKAAPFSFYKTLFQERDKIIVFDEADSLLKNPDIIMMLKPILDTSGSNMAEYMSGTANMVGRSASEIDSYAEYVDEEIKQGKNIGMGKNDIKLPSKFKFQGGMVFISNMPASSIEKAILSRSIYVDVYLAATDVIKRIETIGRAQAKASPNISDKDVDDVLSALGQSSSTSETHDITYMTPEYARSQKQITVRALQLGLILKKSGLARWSELTALYA